MHPGLRLRRAFSTVEVLVAISIVATLLVIGSSSYGGVRLGLYEAQCRQRLHDAHTAILRYREDNRGQDPGSLTQLAPKYLTEAELVCPFVLARAPNAVAEAQKARQANPNIRRWASYHYFSRKALDLQHRKGNSIASYSQILQERQGATPVVACLDHREPHSLWYAGLATPEMMRNWYMPDRPALVLRRNGRVDGTRYGGLIVDGLNSSTTALLINL